MATNTDTLAKLKEISLRFSKIYREYSDLVFDSTCPVRALPPDLYDIRWSSDKSSPWGSNHKIISERQLEKTSLIVDILCGMFPPSKPIIPKLISTRGGSIYFYRRSSFHPRLNDVFHLFSEHEIALYDHLKTPQIEVIDQLKQFIDIENTNQTIGSKALSENQWPSSSYTSTNIKLAIQFDEPLWVLDRATIPMHGDSLLIWVNFHDYSSGSYHRYYRERNRINLTLSSRHMPTQPNIEKKENRWSYAGGYPLPEQVQNLLFEEYKEQILRKLREMVVDQTGYIGLLIKQIAEIKALGQKYLILNKL